MQLKANWPAQPASNSRLWTMFRALVLSALCASVAHGMTDDRINDLRHSTQDLFYHGFDNYMNIAFPEDELLPISCKPLTRHPQNTIEHIGLNDVLGNYSLTLVDSLSTLAILASGPQDKQDKRNPLRDFQDGVKSLVDLYGDGSDMQKCGTRACGFDLDSKVQVFETNIRGVGGLLSAHLFAQGDLPIKGYEPVWKKGSKPGIKWKNGLRYNGQLLRLAKDLAERLLPAFGTSTDIPYPRVNLRHGIPFHRDVEDGFCLADGTSTGPREKTETCAAGAGSLVLEFTALSRMTGDTRFEEVAKKAFWAIWNQRSSIDLLGNGIDAETAQWVPAGQVHSGIGAGIDSFFEYSLKSHILLSNLPYNENNYSTEAPDSFLRVWEQAHAAVKRHIYRGPTTVKHPFYGQVDTFGGGDRASWVDNLSAYWPGLLVLAGEVDEAIESHLLWSALWTRFGALPERWTVGSNFLDSWAKHWAGRPEFIESTFYLYQATKDPYYLHVGEMTLRDIRRRCWTECGWTSLDDVMTNKQLDRMESFFLGETAKYLYLLFTPDHPLNKLDRPIVFTTEGHPLIIPDYVRRDHPSTAANKRDERLYSPSAAATCPAPPSPLPLTVSNTANRADLFHAAALVQLHLVPVQPHRSSPLEAGSKHSPGISFADVRSPTNYTFYPWTLPRSLVPAEGLSSPIINPVTSTLTFPAIGTDTAQGSAIAQNVQDGILLMSLSNVRLGMIQEPRTMLRPDGQEIITGEEFRINTIANWHLGKDQRILLTSGALKDVNADDPHFTRHRDLEMIDLVLDLPILQDRIAAPPVELEVSENGTFDAMWDELDNMLNKLLPGSGSDYKISEKLRSAAHQADAVRAPVVTPTINRQLIPAILPTGVGSIPPGAGMDIDVPTVPLGQLPQKAVYFLDDTLCSHKLPQHIAKKYQILIIRRGGCTFGDKLSNIPAFVPSTTALQLVVVISHASEASGDAPHRNDQGLIRPLLDEVQKTPNGLLRPHPIAMCMVDGSHIPTVKYGVDDRRLDDVATLLKRVASVEAVFDEDGKVREVKREQAATGNVGRGIGVKRRYSFWSMGVPIGNLLMV